MNKIILSIATIFIYTITFSQNLSISVDSNTIDESGSSIMTLTADAATELDIRLPLSLSGTPVLDSDFTTTFDSKGEQIDLFSFDYSYDYYGLLDDGRSVFLKDHNLLVFNPVSGQSVVINLTRNYYFLQVSGNTIYTKSSQNNIDNSESIYTIDISDLSAVVETSIYDSDTNHYFNYEFSVEGDNILFNEYDAENDVRRIYKKEGTNDPDLLLTTTQWGLRPILIDNKAYLLFYYDDIYVIEEDAMSLINFSQGENRLRDSSGNILQIDENFVNVHNGKLYVRSLLDGVVSGYQIFEADLNTGYAELLPYNLGDDVETVKDFSLSDNGDLFLYNSKSSDYGLFKYQLSPQFKIPAGSTTGTVTFTGVEDTLDEVDETLVITPGTPTNGTLADSSDIQLTITDINDPSVVTLELSSDAVSEPNGSVTLTATANPVSGLDVTIPFTLSGTAGSDEYSVSATEIVIPAGSASASVTISAADDTDIEVLETIVFTVGALTNGTTEETVVTLNLESDDDPEVTSIEASPTSFAENASSTVTATINAASSRDVIIPLTISGTAVSETDFTSTFDSKGEETLMMVINEDNNYHYGFTYSNGKYFFIDYSTLRVFDPATQTNNTYSLPVGLNSPVMRGNFIYGRQNNNIYKVDISDLNNISSTSLVSTNDPISIQGAFNVYDNTIYYQTYQNITGTWRVWSLVEGENSVQIDVGQAFDDIIKIGDSLYASNWSQLAKYENGEFSSNYINSQFPITFGNTKVYNDKLYVRNSNTSPNHVFSGEIVESNIVYTQLEYNIGSDTNSVSNFDIDTNTGDLLLYNQSTLGVYSVFSYQLTPQLKIPAGSTTGTITFTGVEDTLDEVDETLVITPGTPTNGTLADSSDIQLTITDINDPSVVTLELSSDAVSEPNGSVTLTATANPVSGLDVTIPFTLSGTAGSDEYSVSATEIVIPAGSASASVTISAADDTEVEVLETIVFTVGALTNGTTEETVVTLNLESDDDPEVTSIEASPTSFAENASSTVTATINAASSRDVIIPLTISGTAVSETDFTTTFDSQGEETLLTESIGYNEYLDFNDDGSLVTLRDNSLKIFNTSSLTFENYILQRYYSWFQVEGDIIYARTSSQGLETYKIDISDLNNIEETLYIENPTDGSAWTDNSLSVENGTIVYNVYNSGAFNSTNSRMVFKKEPGSDPEMIYEGGMCCYAPILYNNKVYQIGESEMYELVDGVYTNYRYHGGNISDLNDIKLVDGKLYFRQNSTISYISLDEQITYDDQVGAMPYISSTFVFTVPNNNNGFYTFDFDDQMNLYTIDYRNDNYNLFSYQLSPNINIPAGSITGTITFTGVEDTLDEVDETIELTPGTVTNGTLADSSDIQLTITDINDPSVVTLELSSDTVSEPNGSVTFTATANPVSGLDVTIPFILSGTAGSDEYSVSATEIVIPAGSASASVTISAVDDTEVEVLETIILTVGTLTNGTTEATDFTLNLSSEDNPNSSLSATNPDMNEGQSTSITLEIDSPTSSDVVVPLILSGSATFNIDYTTDFETEGKETFLMNVDNNYSRMTILDDGRVVFLQSTSIYVYDPVLMTSQNYYMDEYANYLQASGDFIYLKSNQRIFKFNIDQFNFSQDGTNDIETILISGPDLLGSNDYYAGDNITVEGDTVLYQVYDWPNGFKIYSKEGENEAEVIYEGGTNAQQLLLFNNRVYKFESSGMQELYNGEYTNYINYEHYIYQVLSYNNQVYALVEYYDELLGNNVRKVSKLNIESDIVNSNGDVGTYEFMTTNYSDTFDYLYMFGFDNLGNLVQFNRTFENDNYYYGLYSYQLFPEILISAGETEGTFTFQSIDDETFEDDETIIVTPGDPVNATVTSQEPLELSIIDDDTQAMITFELSSETIIENSETSVTLTATADKQSGVEIIIPFTMGGDALADEYELSSESIVIAPNATTGSITISTFGYDDTEVEIAESIIFTFGEITNATTESDPVVLTLLSEDNATLSSVEIDQTELTEGESTTLTLTLNSPSSNDVYVPIIFGGTASGESDYTSGFTAQGEESLIGELPFTGFSHHDMLSDGRHVFLNNGLLMVVAADASYYNTADLGGEHYQYMDIDNDVIYIGNDNRMSTVDITNISSNQVEREDFVILDNVNLYYNFSVDNGVIVYGAYVEGQSNIRQAYRMNSIESNPELLGTSLECCYRTVQSNGNIYRIDSWRYRQIIDGEETPYIYYQNGNINPDKNIIIINDILYALPADSTYSGLVQLDLNAGDGEISPAFDNIQIGEQVNGIRDFEFAPNGNIILINDTVNEIDEYVVQINSYLMSAQLKVDAGETTGSISINTIDDDSYEFDETITINYGTPVNANSGDFSASEIIILDNDLAPTVTFELSSEIITENAVEPVTLTATLSEVSGYDATIPFTMSGTAGEDEYSVSGLSIVIPAGSETGNVEVSTADLDDTEVEMLETIVFTFGELTNATTELTEVVLNLDSDDDPNLVSVEADPLEFAEHESSTITATIDQASSRDVKVPFSIAGTATMDIDYSVSFESLGDPIPSFYTQNSYNHVRTLADGRLVGQWSDYLYVHELDGTVTQLFLTTNPSSFTIYQNYIYYVNGTRKKIYKYDFSSSTDELIYEYDSQSNTNIQEIDVVNDKVFIFSNDYNGQGFARFDYITEGEELVSISSHAGWPGDGLNSFSVNSQEEIFATNGPMIWRVIEDTELSQNGIIGYENTNISEIQFYNDVLYVKYYFYDDNASRISRIDTNNYTIGSATWVYPTPLSYINWSQVPANFGTFTVDNLGQMLIVNENQNTDGQYEITAFNNQVEIIIPSGELTASVLVEGIEDDLNAPGEETDETIEIIVLEPLNAIVEESNTIEDITLTILNNEIDLVVDEVALANVPPMSSSSVAWGDYDRDGDQDMAIMGVSFEFGVITRLYENDNGIFVNNPGIFTNAYEGDLMWVDYNKDGFIDLIVSGLDPTDNPSTVVYENIDGVTFSPSLDMNLPPLFNTSMDSGDLDNDGDIDFIINGQDAENNWKKYIYKRDGNQLLIEQDYNGQFNGDQGYVDGVVRMADSNIDGDIDIYMLGQSDSKIKMNTYINNYSNQNWWENSLANVEDGSMTFFGDYVYYMGQDFDGTMRFYRKSLSGGNQEEFGIDGLKDGDIAIGDYNNDGYEDMVITGENELGESITKLFDGNANGFIENTEIDLVGLRNSTAKWVDYDSDGDLDLFLNGTNDSGEYSLLYETSLQNKTNSAAPAITNLAFENLGNGKVRLSWDEPEDDFSQNLGYIVRLGTTESGSELSNTESNIETGQRLITKSAQINTNSYELLLDPGNYYWSVQSVDGGLRGSVFSEESSFQLTYEWKLLNQGGIIDRSISSIDQPIVKLTDIDGDNDMDLVYGSRSSDQDIQIFRLGDRSFEYFDNINDARGITDIEFLDINNDFVLDLIVNTWNSSQSNFLRLYNSNPQGGFNSVFTAPGLYQAKIELIDINNDGTEEIVHAGRSSESANSQLKIFVYEQNGNSLADEPLDISDQVSGLKQGAFGFGNIDLDEDIDFGITGLSNTGGQSKIYLNETVFTETVAPIFTQTSIDFPAAYESTLDFVDYDNDGDLDIMLTGSSPSTIFKIFANNGLSGDQLDFTEVENTGLTPIRDANIDYGDYNGDGYLDILYTGTVSGQGEVTKLMEFDPDSFTYVESDFDLSDIVNASIAFGDVDGDNDLDFTIAGESASNNNSSLIKTYLNVRNESADVIASSAGGNMTDTGSIVASFKSENQFIVNERPSTPDGLTSSIESYDAVSNTYKVKFMWNASIDDHTPSEGLTYALKIGTSNGGDEIMKVNALSNGYRLSAGKGNVEQSIEWVLNLTEDTYYWSVQSIDASFSGSYFSDISSVFVASSNDPVLAISSPAPNSEFEDDVETVDIEFETTNFEVAEDGSGDGYIMWSINGEVQTPLYNTENITIDVESGEIYTIEIWLVDNDGNQFDPNISSNISFTVQLPDISYLSLQGIGDLDIPSNGGKFIHLVATADIADLTVYGLGAANNGGGTDGEEWNFPEGSSVSAGDNILLYRDLATVDAYMDASNTFALLLEAPGGSTSPVSGNGNDAIELFFNGSVVETYGDIEFEGGSGNYDHTWAYNDSWAYKVDGEWTYGGPNCSDDEWDNGPISACESSCPYPFVECPVPPTTYDVTFSVDTNNYNNGEGIADTDQLYVSGSFNNWSGMGNPMSDDDGDGIWEATIAIADGDYEYKFTMNNWAVQEEFSEVVEGCTVSDGTFTNRALTVAGEDMVLPTVYWNLCPGEVPLSINESTISDMIIYPNPVLENRIVTILSPIDGEMNIEIFSVTGRKILSKTSIDNRLDVSSLNSGFYTMKVTINNQSKIFKLVVK